MKTLSRCVLMGALISGGMVRSAPPLPTVTPTGKSAYNTVAPYLNPGGSLYAYASVDEWAAKLDELVGTIQSMVGATGNNPAEIEATFKLVRRVVAECGLGDLGGLGISSVRTGEDSYHNRVVLQRTAADAKGLYWRMFDGENVPLALLERLPADTALAMETPLRLEILWAWIKTVVREAGLPNLSEGLDEFVANAAQQGISVDAWMQSLGGRIGLVLTVDPEQRIAFPRSHGRAPLALPGFAVAILVEVRDDTIFSFIENQFAAMPGLEKTDTDALRMRVIPNVLPAPMRLTVARLGGYLVLASGDGLVRHLAQGAGGLAEVAWFKPLATDMPRAGVGFSVCSPAFGEAVMTMVQSSMNADHDGPGAELAAAQARLFGGFADHAAVAVTLSMPDALVNLSNTNFDYGQTLVSQLALVPAAVITGMVLPAMSGARGKARTISDATNLKQIGLGLRMYSGDHGERFPDDLGVLMENNYLTAGNVYVSPLGNTPPPTSADDIRAGRCDYLYFGKGQTERTMGSDKPIACTKPGLLGGMAMNVLYGDGHVKMLHTPPPELLPLLQGQ